MNGVQLPSRRIYPVTGRGGREAVETETEGERKGDRGRERRHSHIWYLRWRRTENLMWKSPTECTAGGRTGRECLECCATGNEREYQGGVHRTVERIAQATLMYGA